MSSQFPSALDSFTNPGAADTMAAVPHHQQHADANDAIEALEAKVGITNSAVTSSLDYRVRALEASAGHTHVSGETPSGTVNGSNAVFTLANSPSPAASLMLFLNGLLQNPGGNDFTLSAGTITFALAPPTGSVLLAHYIR